jgi:beta-mannosidase
MFEDCWGEVGWTIVDAYLRRKPAWYFVRRAYAPIRLILRAEDDDAITLNVANDTPGDLSCALDVGYVSLDGKVADLHRHMINCDAFSRSKVVTFSRDGHDPVSGVWLARAVGREDIHPAVFRALDYRKMDVPYCKLQLAIATVGQNRYTARVGTDNYAHGVHFLVPESAVVSDNYFNLLPGEVRSVAIRTGGALTNEQISVTCVNDHQNTR